MVSTHSLRSVAALVLLSSLTACGGGGGGGAAPDSPPPPPPPLQTFTVGGTVTGLAGSGLTLQNNGGNTLAVAANGAFTFGAAISSGSSFNVTVATQPGNPAQVCSVAGGSGTINANVTNIAVTCVSNGRTIGGTVTGLSGPGLVLQNNAGDALAIAANGPFTFATPISEGGAYAVTASAQPASQTCVVSNGSGTAAGSNVTTVAVACATNYTIGATVFGLSGLGLVLSNGTDRVAVDANGTVVFATALQSGASYNILIDTPPAEPVQRCSVTDGSGTVANANINATITCVGTFPTFAYSINSGDRTLTSHAIDVATGKLRSRFNARLGTAPVSAVNYKASDGKQFIYVVNQGSDDISAFLLDPRSGALDEVTGSPFATAGAEPKSLVLHPTRPFLYAPNESGANIAAFTIDVNTGALTQVGPVATGTLPQAFTIEPTGRFAYVAAPGSSELYTYAIDQSSGSLTEVANSRIAIGASAGGITLEREGRYLYLFNPTPGTISAFAIDAASGALTAIAGSPFAAGSNAALAALHPSGRFLYVKHSSPLQTTAGGLSAFAIDTTTGVLNEIAGSPFDTSANPFAASFDPAGRYLYVGHLIVGTPPEYNVRAYTVNPSTGALTAIAGSPYATIDPRALAVEDSGNYLYVTNRISNQLSSYRIDDGSGALTPLPGGVANVGTTPNFVATTADTSALQLLSKFVYTVHGATDSISAFKIDAAGMLTSAAQAPVATGDTPYGITLDPKGRYAYVANTADDSISIYSVHPQTGALTEIASSPVPAAGLDPTAIVIEPAGRYAYVAAGGSSSIVQFTIDSSTGELSLPIATNVSQAVKLLAVTPNGRSLIVGASNNTLLRSYRIDPVTGQPGTMNSIDTTGDIDSLAVDPSGRLVYVTDTSPGALRTFSISSQDDSLSLAGTGSAFSLTPNAVAFAPTGTVAFTADGVSGSISLFEVNANGSATFRGQRATVDNPISIATDYSGKFVYVATSIGHLLTFAFDADTGTLTRVDDETVPAVLTSGTVTTSSHAQ